MEQPALSLIVPVRDEEANLGPLYQAIASALKDGPSWELLLVDDASSDSSRAIAMKLRQMDPRVRCAALWEHRGQSTAILVGAELARGDLVATLDADLQNDPADLRILLAALGDNDGVVGFRVERHDTIVRRISSRVANRIRDVVSGDHVADTGCSLKLFRASALRSLPHFEGMHRFLPTLLRYQGLRVLEVPVSHRPRTLGQSKYGIWNRAIPAFLDLLAVRWMRSRWVVVPEAAEVDPDAGSHSA